MNIEILLRKLGSPSQVAQAIAELDTARLPVGHHLWSGVGQMWQAGACGTSGGCEHCLQLYKSGTALVLAQMPI